MSRHRGCKARDARPTTAVEAIVKDYNNAYGDQRRADSSALVGADFEFDSLYDDHIYRESFFARCWPQKA